MKQNYLKDEEIEREILPQSFDGFTHKISQIFLLEKQGIAVVNRTDVHVRGTYERNNIYLIKKTNEGIQVKESFACSYFHAPYPRPWIPRKTARIRKVDLSEDKIEIVIDVVDHGWPELGKEYKREEFTKKIILGLESFAC